MAIIIQEEKKSGAIIPFVAGLAILLAVAFFVYYLFFSPTSVAEVEESPGFKTTTAFSKAKLDVEAVKNSPVWRSLKREERISPLLTQIISAKTNLFQSFQAR